MRMQSMHMPADLLRKLKQSKSLVKHRSSIYTPNFSIINVFHIHSMFSCRRDIVVKSLIGSYDFFMNFKDKVRYFLPFYYYTRVE